jgi:OOP family OmpA-OmpF porin
VLSAPKGKSLPTAGIDDDFSKPGCVNISVVFDTNSTQVDGIPKSGVQTIMEYLVKNPQDTLTITGHTDSIGSVAFNLELSKRRAQSVKQYLVEQYAIDEHRLIVRGAGKSQPTADNDIPESQAQNRRVTIRNCPQ